MATISLVLDKRKAKSDGSLRICLRLYHKKDQVYIGTGYKIVEKDWLVEKECLRGGCKSIERPEEVNTILLKKKSNAATVIDKLTRSGEIDNMDIYEIRDRILNLSDMLSFFDFSQKVIDELYHSRADGNARFYEAAVNCLKRFFPKKENIYFDEMNYKFLMTLEANYKAKNSSVNGLRIHLQTIRAIFNRAIKEGKVKEGKNPFKLYSIKSEPRHKTAIKPNEIIKLEDIDLTNSPGLDFARNVFLFSFYCMGMDFMDISKLKMKDCHDNRIFYKRSKTGYPYSISINFKIKSILDKFTEGKNPDDYIFPILLGRKPLLIDEVTQERNLFNHRLKRISKIANLSRPLHAKIARHTWANTAKLKNVPLAYIREGLGHRDIKTTQIYLDNFDDSELDMINFEITSTGARKGDIDLKNVSNIL